MLWASAEANGAMAARTMPIGTSRQREARYERGLDLLDRALRLRPPAPGGSRRALRGGSRAFGSEPSLCQNDDTAAYRGRKLDTVRFRTRERSGSMRPVRDRRAAGGGEATSSEMGMPGREDEGMGRALLPEPGGGDRAGNLVDRLAGGAVPLIGSPASAP